MINYLKKFVLASSFVAIATGSSAGDYPSGTRDGAACSALCDDDQLR